MKTETSYDELGYRGGSQASSAPQNIFAQVLICGVKPPEIHNCRVLEIGCAFGDNLYPLAYRFPNSQFDGIDLSQKQIESGQEQLASLELNNLRLIHGDLFESNQLRDSYDYIIAHGFLSWIPSELQGAFFAKIKSLLSETGVAYVSYNTYPGWHFQQALRNFSLFHTESTPSLKAKAVETRNLINDCPTLIGQPENPMQKVSDRYAAKLCHYEDNYIAHDLLEENNNPLYFSDFNTMAKAAGLKYVCDAEMGFNCRSHLNNEAVEFIKNNHADRIREECYADFFMNRTFRRSLICHDSVDVANGPVLQAFLSINIQSALVVDTFPVDYSDGMDCTFRTEQSQLTTSDPIGKRILATLSEAYPESVSMESLLKSFNAAGIQLSEAVVNDICAFLINAASLKHVGFSAAESSAAKIDSAKPPLADSLAKWQLANDKMITNPQHSGVKLNDDCKRLLPLLDSKTAPKALSQKLGWTHDRLNEALQTIERSGLISDSQ